MYPGCKFTHACSYMSWRSSKKRQGIRLIHDCSRLIGKSLNDYAYVGMSNKFQTIDDATSSIQAGCYMSKVDIKPAYRSVSINTESQQFIGLMSTRTGRLYSPLRAFTHEALLHVFRPLNLPLCVRHKHCSLSLASIFYLTISVRQAGIPASRCVTQTVTYPPNTPSKQCIQ